MIIPKKLVILIVAIIIIIPMLMFVGVLPGLQLVESTTTKHYWRGDYIANRDRELIGPLERKGFICSYMDNGMSETITLQGEIHGTSFHSYIYKYKYLVYLKKNSWSDYELMSAPGDTKRYITNPNPGVKTMVESGDPVTLRTSYSFQILGNEYANGAIKAELWVEYKENFWNPLEPVKWDVISKDEAYLYSGYGSLRLPTGIEDGIERPYDTFEIGQVVDIRVETAKGGYATEGEGKTWRVTLNEPHSGSITDPMTGGSGGIVHEQYFDDDVTNGHFKFTVTQEMARISMQSDDPYSVRIWNTILPLGTLYVDFIDFIKLAPSEPSIEGPETSKVGDIVTCVVSATINDATQAPIDFFRISVVYGGYQTLLPSDPFSERWIIHTTNIEPTSVSGSKYSTEVQFKPEKIIGPETYVSLHVKARDTEGRYSVRTKVHSVFIYETNPPPDETIEDQVGEHDYGGGHTQPWLPWDPGGGNWEVIPESGIIVNWIGLLVALLIIVMFAIAGLKMPGNMYNKIIVGLVGVIVAVIIYAWFFTNIFTGVV